MVPKLGTSRISPHQRRMLHAAEIEGAPLVLEGLMTIMRDPDIARGAEEIHPAWVDIYRKNRTALEDGAPPSIFEDVARFFDGLRAFDEGVTEIDPTRERITFLLGAGASKPLPSGIPTVKELLPDLLARARRLDREDVTKLADFCEDSRITNLEDLLTAAQLSEFCSRNPVILRLVDFLLFRRFGVEEQRLRGSRSTVMDLSSVAFLQDSLQVLFGLLSNRMLPAQPNAAHRAIARHALEHPESVIVTTNYDCCMDLALGAEGQTLTYLVEFGEHARPSSGGNGQTKLIKLHGSLNWFYCETCQEVWLVDIERTVKDYLEDRAAYPVIGVCRNCGGQRRGLLVPPLAMKFDVAPPLNPLLDAAQEAFQKADVVAVVGFSFADADLYISRMLSKWMQRETEGRLVVFDPDYKVVTKVRRQFELRVPGFKTDRVLHVGGDCAETIPRFLARELGTSDQSEMALEAPAPPVASESNNP